jgi:hypothetical protein
MLFKDVTHIIINCEHTWEVVNMFIGNEFKYIESWFETLDKD